MTVADGATVSLVCGNANPTPYPEWPDPTAATVTQKLTPGAPGRGGLGFNALGAGDETLTDNAVDHGDDVDERRDVRRRGSSTRPTRSRSPCGSAARRG